MLMIGQAISLSRGRLQSLLRQILLIGTDNLNATETHSTRITNLLALLAIPLTVLNGLFQTIEFPIDIGFNVEYLGLVCLGYVCTLLWNYHHLQKFAKVWICVVFWFDICFSSTYLFGPESGVIWHLLIVFPIAFLLWPTHQQLHRYVILLVTTGLFHLVIKWDGVPLIVLDEAQQRSMFSSVFLDTAVLLGFTAYLFVSDTISVQRKLAHLASHDDLTGILNRREFEYLVNVNMEALSPGDSCALILFDIDDFKKINDRWGHSVGDDAIRHMVTLVQPLLPERAIFGRMGGDEFCVFCPVITIRKVEQLARLVLHQIATNPLNIEGQIIRLSTSIGIAFEAQRQDMKRIYVSADNAMYRAKRNGKGGYEVERY
ncbi:hypothetical protein BTA51_05855 [Hahella sp. CCB-MM4]|uniref:GGDEF domain-containing protein n=1 Tax=Hahella sp. (strain CCB-MM4) TaxID=1926491 RepID=UPI000B9B16E0|nr:GGDEF domain-containing protein [Hahella sp. CCB-MM4]OZG74523.1 hypothetical protein BTA51_05855 [Hahella sp. CCB-MM4]